MEKAFPHRIKILLSNKRVGYGIIVLALVSRIIQLVFFYNIIVDASYQVMATMHLVSGHGISKAQVFASDLSTIVYKPLINWPPGYSILLAPFYLLWGGNYIGAGLTIDILGSLALILVSRKILKLLDVAPHLINTFTIICGFFIYSFYLIPSSDAIAISFFLAGFYCGLGILKKTGSIKLNTAGLIGFLSCSAIIKFLFIPVVMIVPAYLFIKGFTNKKAAIRNAGILSFVILSVLVSAVLFYQKSASGSAAYISSGGRGIFLDNLAGFYPFIPASFIKPETVGLLFHNPRDMVIFRIFQGIHVLLALVILAYFFKNYYRRGFRVSVKGSFFYLSFYISAAILSILIVLSLTVSKELILPGFLWTYVEEARYYGMINLLIHLGVFVFWQHGLPGSPFYIKYSFYFLVVLLAIETGRGVYFDSRRLANLKKEEYSWQYEDRFQRYADSVLNKERSKYPPAFAVVTGSSYYMNHRVSLYSRVPILYAGDLINHPDSLNTKMPVLLLIAIQKKDTASFQLFLKGKGKTAAGQFDDYLFYSMYVKPH